MGVTALTTIDAALLGVTSLGFDTAPFIYFIEQHPDFAPRARAILQRVSAGTIAGYSSTITLTDVLTKPYAAQDARLAARYRAFLIRSRNITLISADERIADIAARLRGRYRVLTPDALRIATAIRVGCDAFLTNDRKLQRVIEIPILMLDELTL